CSAVRFNRRLMLAICASLSTLFDRLVTRRGGGPAAGTFAGSVFAGSVFAGSVCSVFAGSATATDCPAGSEPGHSTVSVAVGVVSAAGGQSGTAEAMADKAPGSNASQCSTGITLAVENVAGWLGGVASADGNRDATVSAGEGAAI